MFNFFFFTAIEDQTESSGWISNNEACHSSQLRKIGILSNDIITSCSSHAERYLKIPFSNPASPNCNHCSRRTTQACMDERWKLLLTSKLLSSSDYYPYRTGIAGTDAAKMCQSGLLSPNKTDTTVLSVLEYSSSSS